MTAAVIRLRPELEDFDLPALTLAEVRERAKRDGNDVLAVTSLWAEDPGARAALGRLHSREVHRLAVRAVELLQREELERPPTPPERPTPDEQIQRQITRARECLQAAQQRVAGCEHAASAAADRVSDLERQGRHPTEVAGARQLLGQRSGELLAARAELDASRRQLARIEAEAADPERAALVAELARLVEATRVERFLEESRAELRELHALGARFEELRSAVTRKATAAADARSEAVAVAKRLGAPPVPELGVDSGTVRTEVRRALASGITEAGGNPRELKTTLDVWHT